MRRDSMWSVVAIAGVVAIISAGIAIVLGHSAQAPAVVRSPKYLDKSSANATLDFGHTPKTFVRCAEGMQYHLLCWDERTGEHIRWPGR